VVVDLGGYNPFAGAFVEVLRLDAIRDVVRGCCEDPEVCPRWLAWELLLIPSVTNRLNSLIGRALGPTEVLFREIWDFVSDLVLQGDCTSEPPSSPWFWRVFFGNSTIARRLLAVADPSVVAVPHDEIKLFYGDWQGVSATPVSPGEFQWLPRPPADVPSAAVRRDMMSWLKAQIALTSQDGRLTPRFASGPQQQLDDAILTENPDSLIEALNRYHTYNLSSIAPRNVLELWFDLSVERRQKRPQGAFSLGSIARSHLSIRRSLLIGNAGSPVNGSRAFLATDAGATLRLDERLIGTLARGRSVRLADRRHDDVDWAIGRFYSEAAADLPVEELSRIATLTMSEDFRSFGLREWSMDPASLALEPT
jgi:hypothetical protein